MARVDTRFLLFQPENRCVEDGNVVFGRGSLSVAESIGGWGFTLAHFITEMAKKKSWTEDIPMGAKL